MSVALLGAGLAVLTGCPVYPDNPGDYRVCNGSACYDCPDDYYSPSCSTWQCSSDYDCPGSYYCDSYGECVGSGTGPSIDGGTYGCSYNSCPSGQTCGADGQCHTGDCSITGCQPGYVCELLGGNVSCVPNGLDASVPDTYVPPPDTGTPDSGFNGCQSDVDCPAPGARCIDGTCVAPADQCFDGTQCPAGDQCVGGVCTPTCGSGKACPTGYTCDANGDCTGNPTPCETGGLACPSGTVCAQNHCVDPCGLGSACPTGEVCVQGGCVPDGKPTFTCSTSTDCASGSTCLHHSCYIACDPDAGTDACKKADQFPVCKPVSTSSGTVNVCGSTTNLGNECAPGGKTCSGAGAVCIDGYCR